MDFGIIRGTRDKIREYSILVLLDSFVEKSIDLWMKKKEIELP